MILQVCFVFFVCCYCVGGLSPELGVSSKGFLYVLHNHLL
jgi:hypothetical protein